MGRHLYLTRLVLGRSPYQEIDEGSGPTATAEDLSPNHAGGNEYGRQQYDHKGRPINPKSESYNTTMRRAMNEVLALVGVVERKTKADTRASQRATVAIQDRKSLLEAENERGENIELLVAILRALNVCWPNAEAILAKLMTGIYKASTPFSAILSMEWQRFKGHGIKGAIVAMNAGAMANNVNFYAETLLIAGFEEFMIKQMQYYIVRQRMNKRTARRLWSLVECLGEALALATDVFLLPLDYFSIAQLLDLAPPTRLLPPLYLFNPFNPASFHRTAWRSPFPSHPYSGLLLSPALLLLASSFISRTQETSAPRLGLLTSFRYDTYTPDMTGPSQPEPRTPFLQDPLCPLYTTLQTLRHKVQTWTTATPSPHLSLTNATTNLTTAHTPDQNHSPIPANGGTTPPPATRKRQHRSSRLALLAPEYFLESVDAFLERIVSLPFETILLRSVAGLAVASNLVSGRSQGGGGVYEISSGGVMRMLFAGGRGGAECPRGSPGYGYVGKMGLAVVLKGVLEVGWCGLLYSLVRWQGLRNFDWAAEATREQGLPQAAARGPGDGVADEGAEQRQHPARAADARVIAEMPAE
ncbi:hypothetical protein MBLNU230_g6049t1 [Neophaeotheca triangularis]